MAATTVFMAIPSLVLFLFEDGAAAFPARFFRVNFYEAMRRTSAHVGVSGW
jgi:hypothetical protein